MQQALGLEQVTLMNNLKAVAYAVPRLSDGSSRHQPGHPQPHGQIAVIAPGTGLGEAFLVWNGTDYIAGARRKEVTRISAPNIRKKNRKPIPAIMRNA